MNKRNHPAPPAPNMVCIGGPYRSQMRSEMDALDKAISELGGIKHQVVVVPVGKRGADTISYLWRTKNGIFIGHELRASQRNVDYRNRKKKATA